MFFAANSRRVVRGAANAVVLVLVLALPRAAHAQLVVQGPADATTKVVDSWYAHVLPACFHAANTVTVVPMSEQAMDESLGLDAGSPRGERFAGLFVPQDRRILLHVDVPGSVDLWALTHEYGHYVWFNVLDRPDRARFYALYQKSRDADRLVSDYAATDVFEGFAEAFMYYVYEPGTLRRKDPAAYEFFSGWAAARHAQAAAPAIPTAPAARQPAG